MDKKDKKDPNHVNALYSMGIKAKKEQVPVPDDLSVNHDQYLIGDSLEDLCSQITEENRHQELDFGKQEGKEIW